MADTVQCSKHGPQQQTFVCQHLMRSLSNRKPVGFFWAGEPRGDAWCAACEEVRVREGGETGEWNERPEAFASIKLVCGACYDEIRKIHGS